MEPFSFLSNWMTTVLTRLRLQSTNSTVKTSLFTDCNRYIRLPGRVCSVVLLLSGGLLFFCMNGVPSARGADTFAPLPTHPGAVITNAILLVTPATLIFEPVSKGKSVTNTFLVENVGHNRVIGTATVAPPFRIISGGSYNLTEKEVQVVTVAFTAGQARTNRSFVTFTGGGVAKATVIGSRL